MRPSLICVAGPPGAGKSTLIAKITKHSGGSKFRLHEAFRVYEYALKAETHFETDELGWRSDEAVGLVLDAAASRGGQFAVGPFPVLLDNFPGNIDQLVLIDRIARRRNLFLSVLELSIDDSDLTHRVACRRVCPSCQPDFHYPATVASDDPRRCGTCGSYVIGRDSDVPVRHQLRLKRYRSSLRELAVICRLRGIPYGRVDGARTVDEVWEMATRMFMQLKTQPVPAPAI